MYIADIKLVAKNKKKKKKELEPLIQAVRIYSQDIGIEFGIRHANNEKRQTTHNGRN